ncbi:BREX-1 system adenine-specific DNA-methyltransferase PglX [Acidilutibacter cellobiosedens]|jgi:hypothetical protein|uniref:site-specific DNA-methyltransferase (adenine-specific) n=1 Tax=Acidilutibacter cellobiosedens TaxID=2507161 RepID=A0A410QB20_9FIRM|nr:BREX-1 system adenine-specific DNA-methyltransferase PglX [Acidilutibacter cellobiosedens]QAT61159.1 BREX-1 system adenine-specific DNA-methyltransferase PglX [Acidilutibacter cellobiosedens]
MDKAVLENFAVYARNKLIQDIKNKASMIGITEEGIADPLPESNSDMLIFNIKTVESYRIHGGEVNQYKKLVEELNKRKESQDYGTAYKGLIEEVAYTWFNRLIAIRFMEVNNYLPDKMRILSSGRKGVNEPEFVTYYQDTSLNFTNEELERLANWKSDGSAASMDNMFHLLFIKQCNVLNENLPGLFEKTDDYAELLLNISYNDQDGVLYKLVHDIPEEYFDVESEKDKGQVEIIGWMYQYYNTERKDEVFSRPKSVKIQKEDVPAVTQLFTPDWIVRYMVENSLGRLWIEKLIADGDKRNEKEIAGEFNWKYYIPEAEQNPEVKEQLKGIRKDRRNIRLEDIKFIDPAMGSFHIGVYAFEVFMQLYESQGYTVREAAKLIIEKNLYGLDIDKRAYQLSYFACMMKGRQYNRRILNGKTKCNLYDIPESNNINRNHLDYLGTNIEDKKVWAKRKKEIVEILDIFKDAKEYGSVLDVPDKYDFRLLKEFIENKQLDLSFDTTGIDDTQKKIINVLSVAEILSKEYNVVTTNPPYMGSSGMNSKLSRYVKDNYPESKSDLLTVFIERCREFTKDCGYYAMITQHSWMFLSSFEKLRKKLQSNTICNMIHLGPRAFEEIGGEVVQSTSFVFKNTLINNYKGSYIKLIDFSNAEEKETKALEVIKNPQCGYYYETDQNNFKKIPGMPVAYWASEKIIKTFIFPKLCEVCETRKGLATSDNNRFLRLWQEVGFDKVEYNCSSNYESQIINKKWFPLNKGGDFKRWYGNNEYLINWENNGFEIKNFKSSNGKLLSRPQNLSYNFKQAITWTKITSALFSARMCFGGFLFDDAAAICFNADILKLRYIVAFLNSKICQVVVKIFNPTLNIQIGDVGNLPICIEDRVYHPIVKLSNNNISISKTDWDSFETSWDFKVHPLLDKDKQNQVPKTIENSYENWKHFANSQFDRLKANEEELNRIFIKIYGLEDELTPDVSDKDITIAKIFDTKNEIYDDIKGNRYILTKEDVVKSFISYAVGCMFGRYSLDTEGLAYAGGKWDDSKYSAFIPDKDNIILITDEEYFKDDILNRFVEFVKVCYGEKTLDENLKFIADALGGNGTPKEIIRNYFLKYFYKDHVRTYKKRPIYWFYDSGKENGFKALIYMHRYNEDTTGKVRIDYLHKIQKAYERTMDNLKYEIANNKNPREVSKAEKRLTKLMKQLKECKDYDERIAHLALARIPIDLDDGVKVNYDKIQIDEKGEKIQILAEIK